jgi:hypothetical protein
VRAIQPESRKPAGFLDRLHDWWDRKLGKPAGHSQYRVSLHSRRLS